VLAILPGEAAASGAREQILRLLGTPVTTMSGADGGLTLCVEADGLSLPHIALEIVERRRDRVDFAGRAHCRTDIAWTPLIAEKLPTDSSVWGASGARATEAQNAMSKTMVL
jgi:hypothetical protein